MSLRIDLVEPHRLRPPLSDARIAVFERVNAVSLPLEYKQFLTQAGDGERRRGGRLQQLSIWRTVELPASLPRVPLADGTHRALRVVDLGCEDAVVLLLDGPQAGRLAELRGGASPRVRPEEGFLEWCPSWLAANDSTPEVGAALDSPDEDERARALCELRALPEVADATLELVERSALHDPSSGVRYAAVELLGELDSRSVAVFLAALRDPKRSVRRRALVHLLRLAGDTQAWNEGLEFVRSTSDPVSVRIADELEQRRVRGLVIPQTAR